MVKFQLPYNLARTDPVNSAVDRLFLLWHAYDEEEALLKEWHEDTANAQKPTGNPLFDFFLDTWGKGLWADVRTPNIPFPQRTYFQALGVVSHQLRQQIRSNVLDQVLQPDGAGKFILPPTLKPPYDNDPAAANKLAQAEIDKILAAFDKCEIASLKLIDQYVETTVNSTCPQDVYLNALLRMMLIETHCFEIQKQFLQTGRPQSA